MNRSYEAGKQPVKKIIGYISRAAEQLLMILIKIYQNFISPCFPARCKYYPTCSHYAADALRKHGAVKGTVLAAWRILRCNPWSRGGVDYVPRKFDLLYYKKTTRESSEEEE